MSEEREIFEMIEVRCINCNRLLFKISKEPFESHDFKIEIKCNKCKHVNIIQEVKGVAAKYSKTELEAHEKGWHKD